MKKVKWFFAEFLVVVSGVLMAFLLNSWWINIQDDKRQVAYLNQIEGEIAETITLLEKAKDHQTERVKSLATMLRTVYTLPESVPADSVLVENALTGMSFEPGTQVSATLKSMVSTGDLQLIENDSLRALLVSAIEKLGNYDRQTSQQTFQWMISTYERFANEIGIFDMILSDIDSSKLQMASADSLAPFPSPDVFNRPTPLNWKELLERPSFKRALENLYVAQSNLRGMHAHTEVEMKKFQKDFERIREKK